MLIATAIDSAELSIIQRSLLRERFPPFLLPLLDGRDPRGVQSAQVSIVTLEENGILCGIALAVLYPALRYADLLMIDCWSINELPLLQLQLLLEKLRLELISHRYLTLNHTYREGDAFLALLAEDSKAHKWDVPYLLTVEIHFESNNFNPPWLITQKILPDNVTLMLWEEAAEELKVGLRYRFEAANLLPALSPFASNDPIEPLNSLLLLKDNEICGWMICHRSTINCIRYSSFYVEHSDRSLALPLLAAAIRLQQRSAIPLATAIVNVEQVERSWLQFAKKRLIPYASKIDKTFATACIL